MMKKNLYKKFQKARKLKEGYSQCYTVEKSSNIKIILSFLNDFIGGLFKVVFYVLIVALCSLGATYLFNFILKG